MRCGLRWGIFWVESHSLPFCASYYSHSFTGKPTAEDLGVGKSDPFGNPLSFSRLSQTGVNVGFRLNPPVARRERVAVDGAFKVPSLRNVELTGPYMHNGGFLTLR